jgi:choline monooxygenase
MTPASRAVSDVDAGLSLPAHWYTDRSIFDLEKERILARSWLYAGRLDQLAEEGDFFTTSIAGMPFVVVRAASGEINAFVNVCRHRGSILLEGQGSRTTIQCPYHAWTYGLDGALRAAPRSERDPTFDRSRLSLIRAQVGLWGPLVFVNPDLTAPPLEEVFGPLPDMATAGGIDFDRLHFFERAAYGDGFEIAANWKLVIENGLECYHCPVTHPGLSQLIDVGEDEFTLEAYETVSVQRGPVRQSALERSGVDGFYRARGEVTASQVYFMWPYFTLNTWPGRENMYVLVFEPVSVDRTRVLMDFFFAEDVAEDEAREMVAFLNQVGQEDQEIVERVQRGLASGFVDHGNLLPKSERLIQWFQRLVCAGLDDEEPN